MNYNTPENLAACATIVKEALSLLYYSHIPTSAIVLLIGLFVLFESKKSLAGKLLLSIAIAFSLWSFIDLSVWLNYDKNTLLMFAWSFFGILFLLIYVLSVYFVYVFIDKKDISFFKKIILGLIMLPAIIFTPTTYNLENIDIVNCIATEGNYFTNYYYFAGLALFFWILFVVITRYKYASGDDKKQILFLGLGIELFLFSFFAIGFLVSYLVDSGYIAGGNYNLEQYGLFGMPIFMAFLAYLIVKHKAFGIKLIAAQALMTALVILIGSQLAFVKTDINRILTGITLALSLGFGYMLVKSVKKEIRQKEELEVANNEITKQKNQLQKISTSLAIANRELKKLDQAKSEFISRASHDLRTPITGIKGYISLLEEGSYGKLSPDQQEAIRKTTTIIEGMSFLIEDLFSASKIESGCMKYEFAKTKIEDICQEVVDTLFIKAKDNNLYLNYKKPKTPLPELMIDRKVIREAISNLVDNAVKYCPKGGVTLTIERAEKSDYTQPITRNPEEKNTTISGPVVRITVADTGIGVPKDEIPRLFAKLSRGKDTSRLNAGGTGLGLYICKGFIEGNGGKIWIESEGEGKGSKFIVELEVGGGEGKNTAIQG